MPNEGTSIFNNRIYTILKYITQIVLPAIGALYFGLGSLWNFPEIDKVVGSISIICVFIGTLLGISSAQYNKNKFDGHIEVSETDGGGKSFLLVLKDGPEVLDTKQTALFKIQNT